MRHKFLKVAALFVAGAFTMNAWAQTDVTSQYLTNADFEAGTASTAEKIFGYGKDGTPYGLQEVQGWEINYVNVDNSTASYPNSGMAGATLAYGSSTTLKGGDKGAPATGVNDATGNCLGFMAVWGCGGYYSQDVTLPAGIYTMTASFYNQSGTQANTSKTGFITEDKSYTMPVNTTVGKWVTQSVSFALTAETKGKIAVGYVSTGGGSGANPHIFIDDIKLSYISFDEVNADNPVEMTSFLVNPSFELNTFNGTLDPASTLPGGTKKYPTGWTFLLKGEGWVNCQGITDAPSDGVHAHEIWMGTVKSIDLHQAVTLPAGKYTISADVRAEKEEYITDQGVYASVAGVVTKSETITHVAENWKSKEGWNTLSTTFNNASAGEVVIGVSSNGIENGGSAGWFQVDNIRLVYLGFDLTEANKALEALITNAQSVVSANEASPVSIQNLNSKIAAAQSVAQTKNAIESAAADLTNAINAANATIAACNAYKTALALSESMYTNSTANDKSVFEAAINKAKSDYNTAADVDAINAIITNLQNAQKEYCFVAVPTEGHPFDMTFLVVNPNFDQDKTGWASDGGAQNKAIASNKPEPITGKFYENWNPSNFTGSIYQEITGLPSGVYKLKVAAYGNKASFFANEASAQMADNDNTPAWYELEVGIIGLLKFGIKNNNNTHWMGIDNVSLYYHRFDAEAVQAELTKMKAGADTLVGKRMNTDVKAKLTAAINAVDVTKTSRSELDPMASALSSAISEATASIEAYVSAGKYFETLKEILATTNVYNKEAYNTYYADPLAKYNNNTLTTEEAKVLTSGNKGHKAENKIDDILLSLWSIGGEQAKDYDKSLCINIWSTEGDNDGSEFRTPFFEYWTDDAKSLGATTIQAKVVGLEAETLYSLTIRARVRQTNSKEKIANGITLQVGDGEPVDISNGYRLNEGAFYIANFVAEGKTDAEGTLTATITVAENSNISWLAFRDVKYSKGSDLSAYIANYEYMKKIAQEVIDKNEMYADDKARIEKMITDHAINETASATKEQLQTATNNIFNDIPTIKEEVKKAAEIYKWNSLVKKEYDKATVIGVNVAAYKADIDAKNYSDEAKATTAVKAIKVDEYNYIATNYKNGVELGSWTATGPTGSLSDQHWSGQAQEYLEQSSAAWGDKAWEIKYEQDLMLPSGSYVFKVAGRRAAGTGNEMSLIVTNINDPSNPIELGKVSDFPEGSEGYGIDVNGCTNFSAEGTYADIKDKDGKVTQANVGRGWEWRYVKFTVTEETKVNVAVNAKATAQYQWVSFCNATVQINNADAANLAKLEYNVTKQKAETAYNSKDYEMVTGAERTALKALIDATPENTKEAIEKAHAALNESLTLFTNDSVKASYNTLVAIIKESADVFKNKLPYASAAKYDAFAATIEAGASPKDAADAKAKADAITNSYRTYIESNALAEGVDGATVIEVADACMEVTHDNEKHTLGAWQIFGQTNGTIKVTAEQSFIDANGKHDYKYADIQKNDNNAGIKQTINLAPGKYIMTVTARAQNTSGATFKAFAGDVWVDVPRLGNTGGVFGNGWNDVTVEFVVNKRSDVEIGVQSGNGKNLWWSATRFRVAKIADPETVEFTISDNEWATIMLPCEASIPTSITAYSCTSVEDGVLTLTEVTDKFAANTPYIVNGTPGKYSFMGVSVAKETTYTSGLLTGTYTEIAAPVDSYVLQQLNGYTAFYRVAEGKQPKIGANRCYLTVPAGTDKAPMFSISRGEDTTGIEKATLNAQPTTVIYDLMGRKVDTMVKGNMYIVNGKKVIIK